MSQWAALPLPLPLRVELLRRARSEAPRECCGLISLGEDGYGLHRAENAAENPTRSFAITPEEQFSLLEALGDDRLVGIYHSHPNGGPEPSVFDRTIASRWENVVWVIVGLLPSPSFFVGTP